MLLLLAPSPTFTVLVCRSPCLVWGSPTDAFLSRHDVFPPFQRDLKLNQNGFLFLPKGRVNFGFVNISFSRPEVLEFFEGFLAEKSKSVDK